MARDYVLQGGDGVISVTANVAPAAVAKVMAAAAGRDAIAAQAADAKLAALCLEKGIPAATISDKTLEAMGAGGYLAGGKMGGVNQGNGVKRGNGKREKKTRSPRACRARGQH